MIETKEHTALAIKGIVESVEKGYLISQYKFPEGYAISTFEKESPVVYLSDIAEMLAEMGSK